jgi:hypothetical protein
MVCVSAEPGAAMQQQTFCLFQSGQRFASLPGRVKNRRELGSKVIDEKSDVKVFSGKSPKHEYMKIKGFEINVSSLVKSAINMMQCLGERGLVQHRSAINNAMQYNAIQCNAMQYNTTRFHDQTSVAL